MPIFYSIRTVVHLLGVILLFVGVQPVWALDPNQSLSQHAIRVWRMDQGLPHDTVISLAQTPDGYLWCGTEHGLARFDGKNFTLFDRNNTAAFQSSHSIHALLTDRLGRLWIGTANGGLVIREGKQFVTLTGRDGLPGDTVYALAEDRNGAIWIGTSEGLSRYSDGRFTNFTVANGLPHQHCRYLCADSTGRVWIGTSRGLGCFFDRRLTIYTTQDGLAGNSIKAITTCRDGSLLVGTQDGVSRWLNGQFTTKYVNNGEANQLLTSLCEDRDGNLWVGTFGGMTRWRGGRMTGQFPKQSLMNVMTFAFHEDTAGNLWAGTSDGLVCLANSSCFPSTETEGLIADHLYCVFEDRKKQLWAGTIGGLSVLRNGTWTSFTSEDGLPTGIFRTIAEDEAGDLWFGTAGGLGRLRNAPDQKFMNVDGLHNKDVYALFIDRKGTLWIGTGRGVARRSRDGQFSTVPALQLLDTISVRFFFEDSTGAMWIGTNGSGLVALRDDKVTQYTTQSGLSSDLVLAIHQDTDGVIWVATHGGGLCRFHDNQWTHFGSAQGMSDDIIYYILEVGPHLWLSSTKGIFRVRKDELQSGTNHIRPLLLGKNDGMRIVDCNGGTQSSGCRTHDGLLWFPTERGLVSVNPAKVRTTMTAPSILIDHVVADGVMQQMDGPISVAPGRGELEFHYTAIDLSAAENIRFRYKLQGYDTDWVEAGGRRTAYYTNLPPNRYTFRVIARSSDGVWTEVPADVELVLRPHFYQTFWFYGLSALIIAAMAFAGHMFRTRQHRMRARQHEIQAQELAKCVAERTSQLQTEVERHARTGELLRQSQKLEAVGQLAGGVAHDFNNLLTVINGYAELILDTHEQQPRVQEMLQEMLSAGRRAADLTHQLLAFSRRQVLSPKVLDPNAVVTDLQKFIGRLIGENIALTTTLDPTVSRVKVDPIQLQQVLINLCVNARDAMPRGGSIQVLTRNVQLGATSKFELPDAEPGDYVLLEVTDTGCGMSESVQARIFEPFFTTKGQGEGTGLGLATVYGIVRQSGGHVAVKSMIAVGTTFQIYLPAVDGDPALSMQPLTISAAPRGAETVLLVEDEASVRAMARHILTGCGYQVLEAEDGAAAMRVAQAHEGQIDLLVTDVVMPRLSGRELAEELKKDRPDMRILFMSGYTDDVVLRHGIKNAEVAFLQKPYSPAALAAKVRSIIDTSSESKT